MEVIKFILISILEILQDDNEGDEQIIKLSEIEEMCKEKKKMKKNNIDLEILKKNSRKLKRMGTRTRNILIDSISKLAERISMKKQKTMQQIDDGPLLDGQIKKNEVNGEEGVKVEIVSISLNVVEYAPKIFKRLRKMDGVGYKELLG